MYGAVRVWRCPSVSVCVQMVKLLQGMVNDPNTLRIASLYLAYRDSKDAIPLPQYTHTHVCVCVCLALHPPLSSDDPRGGRLL